MVRRGPISLRLDDATLENLDEIAKRRQQSRSKVIRTLIAAASYDPFQVLYDASRGEFSTAFFGYLADLDFVARFDFILLREWLLENPYHPKAYKRVFAVVAHYSREDSCLEDSYRDLSTKVSDDAERLKKLARDDSLEREYIEFKKEYPGPYRDLQEEKIEDVD